MVAIDSIAKEKFHHPQNSDGRAMLTLAIPLVVADLIYHVLEHVQMLMH